MKKTKADIKGAIVLLLALVLVVGMSACGTADTPADTSGINDPVIAIEAEPIDIPSPDAKAHAFTDTPDWCADAADWAAGQGIAQGVGNGKFAPSEPCSNAQIITMLWRAAGKPKAAKAWPGTVASYSN